MMKRSSSQGNSENIKLITHIESNNDKDTSFVHLQVHVM